MCGARAALRETNRLIPPGRQGDELWEKGWLDGIVLDADRAAMLRLAKRRHPKLKSRALWSAVERSAATVLETVRRRSGATSHACLRDHGTPTGPSWCAGAPNTGECH